MDGQVSGTSGFDSLLKKKWITIFQYVQPRRSSELVIFIYDKQVSYAFVDLQFANDYEDQEDDAMPRLMNHKCQMQYVNQNADFSNVVFFQHSQEVIIGHLCGTTTHQLDAKPRSWLQTFFVPQQFFIIS